MKIKSLILLLPLILTVCELSDRRLPTKSEIIGAAENAGAINVVVNNYMYAKSSWEPFINTDGGYSSTKENYIMYIKVSVTYSVPQGNDVSHTTIETAIRQLFITNNFSGDEVSVIANPTDLPPSPEETYPLPTRQVITETVKNFGTTSVTISAYTANGKNIDSAGSTAPANASVTIRVNYTYDGLGTVVPSNAAVTLAIRNLFDDFSNLTVSATPTVMYPLPSHTAVLQAARTQGANNATIVAYTAGSETIGEFYYGSKPSNTPIHVSLSYNGGAIATLVEQAARGLFQHFTNITIYLVPAS